MNSQNYCPEVTRMTMVDYCPRPSASGNSPPGHPRANGFDYSPNSHEITVLLPNNNIHVYTRYHEDSIRPTLHISSK